ncbi:hypothetical protein [Caballeronia sp. BR00000012568055]|uniref:hypothetical protein n=1 Tax=Caballeronia sp. BR00000012568055 TaxID=2918761 RepID=UPI0023F7E93F|nr:hypothetical protein [Caballeronia sp. BR00000012568055]
MNAQGTQSASTKGATPMDQAAKDQPAQPAGNGPTQSVTVARGRSIRHDGKLYRAGESVTLPADDAERFRALGFVASENATQAADDEEAARTQGPTFESKDGPNVKPKR